MKTPMQELIKQLKESAQFINDDDHIQDRMYRDGLSEAIENAESMLEEEKAVMCEFAYKCRDVMAADKFAITHWYDKTFNTKESST